MASSPSPSSLSDAASPHLPTPRSKIRALLATVSSDDEADTAATNGLGAISPSRRTNTPDKPSDSEQESDESDVLMRPRGKLASRMRGASSTPVPVSNSPRNRVQDVSDTENAAMHDAPSDDNHQDLPVAPRRLKRRTDKQGSPRAASLSPGLFVSSPTRPPPSNKDSESENDLPTIKSDRFKELVERKRQERLAREAAAEAENAQEREGQEVSSLALESDADDEEDGRRLSQAVGPKKRKASKKAIEEMNRETQRMARSMQLSHEPRTRKKITKSAFFDKFCYKSAKTKQSESMATSSSRPTSSYTESENKAVGTPPSSPPALKHHRTLFPKLKTQVSSQDDGDSNDELPFLDEIVKAAQEQPRKDKGKARATDVQNASATEKPMRRIRVRMPVVAANTVELGSDDELEVTKTTRDKINAVFDRVPAEQTLESRSLRALRALAQIKSPPCRERRKNEAPCMTAGQLHLDLFQKARRQAKNERQRRLELLKSQGIEVQSAAERERQEQEVEDLVAKAREEARLIMQQERDAANKENKDKGKPDIVDWDDSEDEEYEEAANESDGEASAIQLSGSEEEQDQDDQEDDEQDDDMPDADEPVSHPLLDQDAKSDESEAEANSVFEDEAGPEAHQDSDEEPRAKRRRNRKHTAVMSDDEAAVEATPRNKMVAVKGSPYTPNVKSDSAEPYSVLRSARKPFIPGLPVKGAAGLGLTQIFAGTMDEEEQKPSPLSCPQQSLMPDIDVAPQWARPSYSGESSSSSDDEMIMDSQHREPHDDTQLIQLNASQSQMRGLGSLLRDDLDMQPSQFVFTQDSGPQIHTPIKQRYIELPHSTMDTLLVSQREEAEANGSPVLRKGRLRRKLDMQRLDQEPCQPTAPDAFEALADGAKELKARRLQDQFNRKKSKAKTMVDEQAEESEDEYAGLGGADGEDSDNESAGSVREIIDDEAGNDVDERKLAAFYADRERAQDEKDVEKLFKNITKGMLRRKRGADFDLSDSDDGGAARRRMRRRQFNKMQKALFADERIQKIAQDPGNQAFLRTIEDHDSEDELEVVEAATEGPEPTMDSQDDGPALVPDSQPTHRKAVMDDSLGRNPRRTKNGKKPSNIGEVRQTLSSLLAEREVSVIPATEIGSDSDDDDDNAGWPTRGADKENAGRRAKSVVNRISLNRNMTDPSGQSRLAFAAASSSSTAIRIPTLLRRATTNSSLLFGSATSAGINANSASAPGANSSVGFGDSVRLHKGATKSSGVSGFGPSAAVARAGVVAPERRLEGERRRELRKARGAQRRMKAVGGLLGKGSFE
ncbi:hypothetical protein CDD82_2361 [Ophiocordyceps australis]|uniref:DNA replication checkpoint mediator MRC1 domain-containing protein n=1 Tax=Ophiocordyceps australis TaxID=1399860 RepID=A0A2C5ZHZ8_9HYPO|nr:hypothetical protein CDD82_2361 [Ophiocordyceps australis]